MSAWLGYPDIWFQHEFWMWSMTVFPEGISIQIGAQSKAGGPPPCWGGGDIQSIVFVLAEQDEKAEEVWIHPPECLTWHIFSELTLVVLGLLLAGSKS